MASNVDDGDRKAHPFHVNAIFYDMTISERNGFDTELTRLENELGGIGRTELANMMILRGKQGLEDDVAKKKGKKLIDEDEREGDLELIADERAAKNRKQRIKRVHDYYVRNGAEKTLEFAAKHHWEALVEEATSQFTIDMSGPSDKQTDQTIHWVKQFILTSGGECQAKEVISAAIQDGIVQDNDTARGNFQQLCRRKGYISSDRGWWRVPDKEDD